MSPRKSDAPVTSDELRKAFRWQDVALVLAILGSFLGGYIHLVGEARAQSDAGTAPLKVELADLAARQRRYEDENQRVHGEVRQELHEVQVDIRALYKAVMTGAPQPRLEAPADGGR